MCNSARHFTNIVLSAQKHVLACAFVTSGVPAAINSLKSYRTGIVHMASFD